MIPKEILELLLEETDKENMEIEFEPDQIKPKNSSDETKF